MKTYSIQYFVDIQDVYYETIKWDLKIKSISECRCDERLKTKTEKSTRLTYTGFHGELEHLKIKTRSIDTEVVKYQIIPQGRFKFLDYGRPIKVISFTVISESDNRWHLLQ